MRSRVILLSLFLHLASGPTARADYSDHRNRRVDSLENVLQSGQSLTDEERMLAYKGLMWGYQQTDGNRSAHYAREALRLSYAHDWLSARSDALRMLGMLSYGSNDYEAAINYYMQALAVADSMRSHRSYNEEDVDDIVSSLYGSIGNLYNIQDSLHLAIAYYQKALPLFEKHRWTESTSILYYNVGELYQCIGNTAEAERNYVKSDEAARLSGDSLLIAMACKGLAKTARSRDDLDAAERRAREANAYYSLHRDEEAGSYLDMLVVLARVEMGRGHDLSAVDSLIAEAMRYVDSDATSSETRADVYNLCCETAMERREWGRALEFAQRALDTDSAVTYSDMGTYAYMTKIYAEMGDAQKVKECVARLYNGMEELSSAHYQSALSQMEVMYETEKKQSVIEGLRRERRWYQWGVALVGGLLLLTVLLFLLLWRGARLRRKAAFFQATLEGETRERRILARDLHDGLGGMLSLLRLKIEGGATRTDSLSLIDSTARELRRISHHLLPEELLRGGLCPALADFAISVPGAQFHQIGEQRPLPRDVELVLYRCAYELVNNAIKHAHASHINIQLMQQDGRVTLTVNDDGCGFDTQSSASHGMGLQNIRDRIAHYRGTMDIDSDTTHGTEVNVTLPI